MNSKDDPILFCIVGSGARFMSGISTYTLRLANAMDDFHEVSVVLMRQLLPARLYPGRRRVGVPLTDQVFNPDIQVFDGVDWYWLPSIFQALAFLKRLRPQVVCFQWWTGAVLHSYILLAWFARLLGAKILLEFHEVQDTGEARLGLVRKYVNLVLPGLIRLSSGYIYHSQFDRAELTRMYALGDRPFAIVPHGPYDHYQLDGEQPPSRVAPAGCCNLLYFGVIRPFKGLEDLVTAFSSLPEEQIDQYWLTIVGEPWEGWDLPFQLVETSPYRERITLVNRYVHDREVAAFFAGADVVVLPYHRSSASGPLQIAMSCGLPVIVTDVGGLPEAVQGYPGAVVIPPQDPDALQVAIHQAAALQGNHYPDPHSWEHSLVCYSELASRVINQPDGAAHH